jgi:hypothetical protein
MLLKGLSWCDGTDRVELVDWYYRRVFVGWYGHGCVVVMVLIGESWWDGTERAELV